MPQKIKVSNRCDANQNSQKFWPIKKLNLNKGIIMALVINTNMFALNAQKA
ncbi:hypothetical protein [Arsenophonus endosymbiont of Aphis craccivora]|uniref:hypothetical protein n=1 Tax=Arsenophonus endosymbiont of Aphis craccivora TaxID=1231049 RepID=UPI001EE323C9|nr:hypothetical protein [Arsenophonus endosymbiont of Aphis craccivora]